MSQHLRVRASLAYLDRRAGEQRDLLDVARRALADVIGPAGANGADVHNWQTETQPAVDIDSGSTGKVYFTVDGVQFRVEVQCISRTAGERQSNTGLEWEETTIRVTVRRHQTDYPVVSLADIGKVFAADELPDDAAGASLEDELAELELEQNAELTDD